MLKIICVDGISMAGIRVRCFFGGIPKRRASLQRIDESVGYKNGMVALASDHAKIIFFAMKNTCNLKKVARSIVIIMKIITTFSSPICPLLGRSKGGSHEWPCLKFLQIFIYQLQRYKEFLIQPNILNKILKILQNYQNYSLSRMKEIELARCLIGRSPLRNRAYSLL